MLIPNVFSERKSENFTPQPSVEPAYESPAYGPVSGVLLAWSAVDPAAPSTAWRS
jgi:hypothetical protein